MNATRIPRTPDVARFLNWQGRTYVLNNADGTFGAITFEGPDVVGVFFDSHSERNPIGSTEAFDEESFFSGMPPRLRSIAETQTLKCNRQDYRGATVALITAAFWSDSEYLTAAYPWAEVLRDGAHIVRIELIEDLGAAKEEWRDYYQCLPEELDLASSLLDRRLSEPGKEVFLKSTEVELLRRLAESPETFADCLRALEPLGIVLSR